MAVLVKIGGSLMEDPQKLEQLALLLSKLEKQGKSLVLVHGGGKDISRNLTLLQEQPEFVGGLRVTSKAAMQMVENTLSAQVNKFLVRLLIKGGGHAVGISGVDGPTFICKEKDPDLGLVGSMTTVNTALIDKLLEAGFLPVVSPVSLGPENQSYNVNADEAATALAIAMKVERLIFVSDVPGVMDSNKTIIPLIDRAESKELIDRNIVSGGMIPKINSCMEALSQGVSRVHICGWEGTSEFEEHLRGESKTGTVLVYTKNEK